MRKAHELQRDDGALFPHPPSRVRQRVVGLTLALIGIAYLDRVCIATAAPMLQKELSLSDAQLGLAFSAFTLSYALFEIPSGWLVDRFGARTTLTRIVLWWSLMTAATGRAWGFVSLVIIRLLFGLGEAGAFPATARVYARWLPSQERGAAFGAAVMVGVLSGALTQPLVSELLAIFSWRTLFPLFGGVGVVWSIVWYAFFRDEPRRHRSVNEAELTLIEGTSTGTTYTPPDLPGSDASARASEPSQEGEAPPDFTLFRREIVALCVTYFGTIYGWYFYFTWLPTYLLRVRDFDLRRAGFLSAVPLLAIALGVFGGGALHARMVRAFGPRRGVAWVGCASLLVAAAAVAVSVLTAAPLLSVLFFAIAGGVAALGVAPAWIRCLEIGGPRAGVVSGAMNMFGNLGGALMPAFVGWSLQRWGSFRLPLLSMVAVYLVSAVSWLFTSPAPITNTRPREGS